ncbi:hypothetical protein [Burkholderia thailandensis]|nr:hypothetical protein [Burkholderia thailandensis]
MAVAGGALFIGAGSAPTDSGLARVLFGFAFVKLRCRFTVYRAQKQVR